MMKVMVVDDEKDIERLFRMVFREEMRTGKVDFYFAFSGESALSQLEDNKLTDIVLILSDINMPGMNGLELLKIIKTKFPEIKVFMVTAYDDSKNYRTAMEYGADDYFTKPIDFDTLRKKMFNL
jgi:YesN/AraC family two-component response regulator